MGAKEKATALHERGFNCAQSVLAALSEFTGLDEAASLSVACGFGGGVSCGEICGAAAGAVMALGLAWSKEDPEDAMLRSKVRQLSGQFNREFQQRFGCIRCMDLKKNRQPCPLLIEYAAEAAENMIKNQFE